MNFFKKIFILILFRIIFSKKFYISNNQTCFKECDGSSTKPFPNFLNGLAQIYKDITMNKISDVKIEIFLVSNFYTITEEDVINSSAILDKKSNGEYYGLFEKMSSKAN